MRFVPELDMETENLMKKLIVLPLFLFFINAISAGNTTMPNQKIHIDGITSEMIKHDEGLRIAVDMINGIENSIYRSDIKTEIVSNFMKKYFSEMYLIEVLIAQEMQKDDENQDEKLMDELLYKKKEVFEKYWLLDDKQRIEYYSPSSWSSEPKFNWSKIKNIQIFETGDDYKPQFMFMYSYPSFGDSLIEYVFSLKYVNNEFKITDYYFKIS